MERRKRNGMHTAFSADSLQVDAADALTDPVHLYQSENDGLAAPVAECVSEAEAAHGVELALVKRVSGFLPGGCFNLVPSAIGRL